MEGDLLSIKHVSTQQRQMWKNRILKQMEIADGLNKLCEDESSLEDAAYMRGVNHGDVTYYSDSEFSTCETHGSILVENYRASCSIYLPNWMNQRRKDFVWDFKTKELHVQTLSKILNPSTNEKEWQWRFGVGQIGSRDRKYFSVWESDGIEYKKRKCK